MEDWAGTAIEKREWMDAEVELVAV